MVFTSCKMVFGFTRSDKLGAYIGVLGDLLQQIPIV